MKRMFIAYAWLLLSSGAILTSIAGWQFLYIYQSHQTNQVTDSQPVTISSAAGDTSSSEGIEGEVKGVETVMEVEDARPKIVANFLKRYDSPLKPYDKYGQVFVDLADKNGFDFRLLPAIAMQESNLCKKIPEGSFNCLGFGIHERGTLTFESYEANFERAARELKKNYIDRGLTTPAEIMTKYTPGSNGSWEQSVNQWMAEMRYDDRALGRELKTDASVLEFADSSQSPSPTPQN